MIEPGTRLGPYEILMSIGAGGMGEVYRARDANLKRDVAVKVLPATLRTDPARMARFRREAEVLASLNHPGIATIYGFEGDAIIMELVEGQTLAGPLPVETALQYARQIVDALEYAHDRGVIHRDLKPANIKITPEGGVKLLDFGLAKALDDPASGSDPANSPTLTLGYTQEGTILGTAAYMSPEQAVGKPVDRRSDIFSFGAVLYEMLTGKHAFTGDSAGDILAAIVKDEPDTSNFPGETPEWLRALLRRCLVKDRKQRLQAIGEARLLFENPPQPGTSAAAAGSRLRNAGWLTASLLAVAAGVSLWFALQPELPSPRVMTHFTIPIPQGSSRVGNAIALSRDGSRLAFVGGPQRQIFVRDMGQVEARPIPGITAAAYLSLSPDGQWISYVSEDRLNRVPVAGGPVQLLANAPAQGAPPTQRWETDGFIWFTTGGVVRRVPEGGGKEEVIATPDRSHGEGFFFAPQLLPGGKKLLVTSLGSPSKTIVIDLSAETKTLLLEGPEGAQFVPIDGVNSTQGRLIYFDSNTQTLMAVAFDTGKQGVEGVAVPLIEKIQAGQGPLAWFAISPSGTLAYVLDASTAASDSTIVWVDQKGKEQPVPATARRYNGEPRISPDGTKAAILVTTGIPTPDNRIPGGGDIWVVDLERGTSHSVTRQENVRNFVWSHDSKRIIYSRAVFANRDRSSASGGSPSSAAAETSVSQLFSAAADGVGTPILLKERQSTTPYVPLSVARDGTLIGGNRGNANAPNTPARRGQIGELWLLSTTQADADVRPFRNFPSWVFNARFSPDDRLVAYQSADSNQFEIYVVPYPGKDGERVQVSPGGGTDPRWSADGELFYRNGDKVMKVDVLPNGKFGLPRTLFDRPGAFDVHRDGRLLMIKPAAQSNTPAPEMHIILNWFEDLR